MKMPKKFQELIETKPARFVFVPGRTRTLCVHTQFPECVMGITKKGIFHPRFMDSATGEKLSEPYKATLMIKALQVYIMRMVGEIEKGSFSPDWGKIRHRLEVQSS